MRREMKHPMIRLHQEGSQNQYAGIVSTVRAVLVRARSGFNSANELPVKDYSQMASAAGYTRYSIRQQGSRPH